MGALRVVINVERKKEMMIDYGLEHLWLLTSAVYAIGGGELKTPKYLELAYPERKFEDNRTTEEIKQYIVRRLTE